MLTVSNLDVGLRTRDGCRAIVRNVSFELAPGRALGVVGESGSGKSLTAQAIGGMFGASVSVLGGQIALDGNDLTRMPESQLHRLRGKLLSYVFQDPLNGLNPTRRIGSHLMDVYRQHTTLSRAEAKTESIRILESVGIAQAKERLSDYPHQLSGGMRQRVLIAMALICNPKLLIADEPTTALDVTVQAKIVELFQGVQQRGIALLFISHNLELVLEFCDDVVVMYGGRVMEKGSAWDVGLRPKHPYTSALLRCVPRLDDEQDTLDVIEGSPPSDLGGIKGCPFAERCPNALSVCQEEMPAQEELSETHSFSCWNPL